MYCKKLIYQIINIPFNISLIIYKMELNFIELCKLGDINRAKNIFLKHKINIHIKNNIFF